MTLLPYPSPSTAAELGDRAARIDRLLLDVDGVLTDGRVIYGGDGTELKHFHVRDGSGLKFWHQTGKRTAVISGRSSPAVAYRARELGIEFLVQGCSDKLAAFRTLGLEPDRVCAIGDDLPDLPVMLRCGLAVAVADACPEVKRAAHWVAPYPGGKGAVRAAVEWLLSLRGEWDDLTDRYRIAG
ncbi:MAG TPA: HAD hydrolase family protein [Fimbriiglobus sp.]|jgi:3-deoxy-D-manno-octulosonate 8-phosphate phosphatase (KDO 8-P phosphatase)